MSTECDKTERNKTKQQKRGRFILQLEGELVGSFYIWALGSDPQKGTYYAPKEKRSAHDIIGATLPVPESTNAWMWDWGLNR